MSPPGSTFQLVLPFFISLHGRVDGRINMAHQLRDDNVRRGVAAPNGPPCGDDEVPSPEGGARVAEGTRGVGEGELPPPQDEGKKVEKARGPTLEDALDDVQVT